MLRLAIVALCAALSLPALAGEAGDISRSHLYGGTIGQGLTELKPFYEHQRSEPRL